MCKNLRITFCAIVILILAWSVTACGGKTPEPSPTMALSPTSPPGTPEVKTPVAQATSTPTEVTYKLKVVDDGSALPPRVVSRKPAGAQEVGIKEPIEVTFDQPMDKARTAQALKVVNSQGKEIQGEVTWPAPNTLRFTPWNPFERGMVYFASLSTDAVSALAKPLTDPYRFEFNTAGEFKILQVFPADGTSNAETKSVITVIFNRPVVPLVIAEEKTDLPIPIRITPEVAGEGEWVNTSTFVFHPDSLLPGGTNYSILVPAGLKDVTEENELVADFSWKFTTAEPGIDTYWITEFPWDVNPPGNRAHIRLDQGFAVRFRQPMDRGSVEQALSITSSKGERAPLTTQWGDDDALLVITPTQNLELGTGYVLTLDNQARSIDGGSLERGLEWKFTTVKPPAIEGTLPLNNSTQTMFDSSFTIQFASPMRLSTLKDKVTVNPPLENEPEWYYNEDTYNGNFTYTTYGLAPSTNYEVRIQPGMEDIYGNTIKTSLTVRFKTAAAPPSAYLQMPQAGPVLYRSDGPQDFYVTYQNIKQVDLKLYRLTPEKYASLQYNPEGGGEWNYVPPASDLVWKYTERSSAALNKRELKSFKLAGQESERLAPGLYFLTLDSPQVDNYGNPFDDRRTILVAAANLTFKTTQTEALVWLTDLTDGKPLSGASVTIYGTQFNRLGSGQTGSDGTFFLNGLTKGTEWYDTFYALVDDPRYFGFAAGNWGSGPSPYDFGIWQDYYSKPDQELAYVYTDRPLYRPGQPVYFKGIVRMDDDAEYNLPDISQVLVQINSFEHPVYSETLPLSSYGSFSGKLDLDENAALGSYTIYAMVPAVDGYRTIGQVDFGVAEYRKPEFLVSVTAVPTNVLSGESFEVTIQADYFSGGPVVDADVAWTLNRTAFSFTPPDEYSAYNFSDFDQDVCFYCTEYPTTDFVGDGRTQTDENGRAVVTVPADLADKKTSQEYTFEASVTDFAGTLVAGRTNVIVHRSGVYPGIRSEAYVGETGKEQVFHVVALDWDGKPLPGQKVDVEIVERRWYSVQEQDAQGRITWSSSVKDIPVTTFEGVELNAQAKADVRFTPQNGGVFRARVTGKDSKGNTGSASAYIWVAGEGYVPWRQSNNRSLDLVKDRSRYNPGDTAEILIASPFQEETFALVTVERGHIRHREVIQLTSNSTIYRLPITADMAPNVYFSVVIIHGAGQNSPPDFRMGMTELKVDTREQALKVEVKADRTKASPGETVNYTVSTTDASGGPVSAEVSLGLSDLAALKLSDPNSKPIIDAFYYERGLSVWTAVPIVFTIEDYNAELAQKSTPQGLGQGSGGGKGYGEEGVIPVRGNFPDTAFWEAQLLTGDNGEATVSITLPDNLTTWRMDARAVTLDTHVGQVTDDLVSTKPLLVRPQTPRFFVAGDEAVLSTAVHNNTGQDLAVTVSLDAKGLELESQAAQDVTIPNGLQAVVTWNVRVPMDSTRVDLVFSAVGGGFSDASLPTLGSLEGQGLPVLKFEAPEIVGTSGQMLSGGTTIEAIYLPSGMEVTQGTLTVKIAPSLAAGMTDGLKYLKDYPYECVEQLISRFLPNVVSLRALKEAGLSDPELEKNLDTQVSTALQRLYNMQNSDGGWGWWGDKKSDPLTTAYAVLGLTEARSTGYSVSDDVINRALDFLEMHLGSVKGFTQPYQLNRQAFLLYVLARADREDVARSVQLYDERQNMAIYARALLAETLHRIDSGDSRISTLLSDLANAAVLSATGTHWEEESADYYNWNTDTRTTAIVLSTLSRIDAQNPLNANAVRWLMAHRTDGHWYSTQETAWSLLALTNWMVASGELQASYDYGVAFNGEQIGGGTANTENLRQVYELQVDVTTMLKDQANRLAIARSDGSGNLYYTAHLNVNLPVEQVQALDQGVTVARSYYEQDDPATPITEAVQGDLVLVKVTVVAPAALHYLVVEDPLPAGLEAVDTSLKTSPTPDIPGDFRWDKIGSEGWGWWYFPHVELRDEKVVLSTDFLPQGTYTYTYLARASTPGTFKVIPTTAHEFYFPEVYGRGSGSLFQVMP